MAVNHNDVNRTLNDVRNLTDVELVRLINQRRAEPAGTGVGTVPTPLQSGTKLTNPTRHCGFEPAEHYRLLLSKPEESRVAKSNVLSCLCRPDRAKAIIVRISFQQGTWQIITARRLSLQVTQLIWQKLGADESESPRRRVRKYFTLN